MAAATNFQEEYQEVEDRVTHISNLLRARCFVLSMRNSSLSDETLKNIQDSYVYLIKLKSFTDTIVELDSARRLSLEEMYRRETITYFWSRMKTDIEKIVDSLEAESNLLKSLDLPSSRSVVAILYDLDRASTAFQKKAESLGTEAKK